jgi:hypothetical protein
VFKNTPSPPRDRGVYAVQLAGSVDAPVFYFDTLGEARDFAQKYPGSNWYQD